MMPCGYRTNEFRLNGGPWNTVDGGGHLDIFKLRPGNYLLEFRGFDRYGSLISFPSVRVRANIVFYKSVVFLVSGALVIFGLLVLIILIIRRNRRKEMFIKENISMDLHDEVGTILTKALLAQRSQTVSSPNRRVEEYLLEGIHSLRLFIKTMNQSRLSLKTLVVEIRENIAPALTQADVGLEIIYDKNSELMLRSGLFRDVKLCVFEAVNNALKYAYAGKVTIVLVAAARKLDLTVTDDGLLTDLSVLENRGSGVGNLRKRADRNGGAVEFQVASGGHGLSVRMCFEW